jgi:hypothetical protein
MTLNQQLLGDEIEQSATPKEITPALSAESQAYRGVAN